MEERLQTLHAWLKNTCGFQTYSLQPMLGDASFRRYFRMRHAHHSYVVMDAASERASCIPFIAIAKTLRQQGILVPEVIHAHSTEGFILLTDFGDQSLLQTLIPSNMITLYSLAMKELTQLQACPSVTGWTLPLFTAERMQEELLQFKHWFLEQYLKLTLPPALENKLYQNFQFLSCAAAAQPQTFMHRDFHSANLMVLPENKIGILDFQDAFIGPLLYDLVSLLRDCYIDWPKEHIVQLALMYRDRVCPSVEPHLFLRWFDLMGLQRHLKALLTFSRKYVRDQDPRYLRHVPRTLNYIISASHDYPECKALHQVCNEWILPTLKKQALPCAP